MVCVYSDTSVLFRAWFLVHYYWSFIVNFVELLLIGILILILLRSSLSKRARTSPLKVPAKAFRERRVTAETTRWTAMERPSVDRQRVP